MQDYKKMTQELMINLRKETNMGLREFSRLTKLDASYLSRWESGEKHPTISVLFKISQALNKPIVLRFENVEKADLRDLKKMQNSEFHRFFQSNESDPFSKEQVDTIRGALVNEKVLFLMLHKYGRPGAYERMRDEGFDITFKRKRTQHEKQ